LRIKPREFPTGQGGCTGEHRLRNSAGAKAKCCFGGNNIICLHFANSDFRSYKCFFAQEWYDGEGIATFANITPEEDRFRPWKVRGVTLLNQPKLKCRE
jgi:hypothetical protein